MSSQPPTASESRFDRWWWRVWYVFFATVLAWLGVCAWLLRPAPSWTEGALVWWSGDQSNHHPSFSITTHLGEGNPPVRFENDLAYASENGSEIHLGRLPPRIETWTWTGWIHVTNSSISDPSAAAGGADRRWSREFVVLWQSRSLVDDTQFGVTNGRLHLVTNVRQGASPQWEGQSFHSTAAPPFNEWFHAAVARDGRRVKAWINGTNVLSMRSMFPNESSLSSLILRSDQFRGPNARPSGGAYYRILHDDLVMFNRVLRDEEVAALHGINRGGWMTEMNRHSLGQKLWAVGWKWAMAVFGALIVIKLGPKIRAEVAALARETLQP